MKESVLGYGWAGRWEEEPKGGQLGVSGRGEGEQDNSFTRRWHLEKDTESRGCLMRIFLVGYEWVKNSRAQTARILPFKESLQVVAWSSK